MNTTEASFGQVLARDLPAGLVVYLVALPLCLGVALASNAPLSSGLLAGIVGGLVVGSLSGSRTSVSGPAAGLTAVVAAQIATLGSFSAFLTAVVLAGVIQIGLGLARSGFLALYFPSSVIKGLLAAIGVILILKQLPHVVGHDPDPFGEMSFIQPDGETTFSELLSSFFDIQPGATLIGLLSVALLFAWGRIKFLKDSPIPAPLIVVLLGVAMNYAFLSSGSAWVVGASHLVQVPVAEGLEAFSGLLQFPDLSQLARPAVYSAALTVAVVASLETLLNLEAVDRLDPEQRLSPPNRELLAQGAGNIVAGFVGGLPVTSVIVRSSVNIQAKNHTKLSTIFHGALLLASVLLAPHLINMIPLSALAAILLVTGFKLASPKLAKQMWSEGWRQFVPFVVTISAIVLFDLLTGILVGLAAAIGFILQSNFQRPLRRFVERHVAGDVLRIELANQVSFFSRATLSRVLQEVPRGGHVLIDARGTDYFDQDILDLIEDFHREVAPAHGVQVSLLGFKEHYDKLEDQIQFVDYSSRELQSALTPDRALEALREGQRRFRSGRRLERDLMRQVRATAPGQSPLAVILSCIDSRAPVEVIFDLGIGDIFTARIAGNVAREKVLGSMEYACAVAGAKLVLVLGHTACGAVKSAVELQHENKTALEATGCEHIDVLIDEIKASIDPEELRQSMGSEESKARYCDEVARRNVLHTMGVVRKRSATLDRLLREGKIGLVGGLYDVRTGGVDFFDEAGEELQGLQSTSEWVAANEPDAPAALRDPLGSQA